MGYRAGTHGVLGSAWRMCAWALGQQSLVVCPPDSFLAAAVSLYTMRSDLTFPDTSGLVGALPPWGGKFAVKGSCLEGYTPPPCSPHLSCAGQMSTQEL